MDNNQRLIRKSGGITYGILLLLSLVCSFYLTWNLNTSPTVNWDEGWTMLVARHLVEDGVYGRLPVDGPRAAGLSASFPTVLWVAAGFWALGVGVWQARLMIVLITVLLFGLLYLLARLLFSQRVALASLAIMIGLAPHAWLNPLFIGKQVFAEPLQMVGITLGLIGFLQRDRWRWAGYGLMFVGWGVALLAKAQTLPFLLLMLLVGIGLALWLRQRQWALELALALVGSVAVAQLLNWGIVQLLGDRLVPSTGLPGLSELIALAYDNQRSRQQAQLLFLVPGLLFLYASLERIRLCWPSQRYQLQQRAGMTQILVMVFTVTWLLWFAFLSVGWPRYLLPPLVISSMLVADLADRWLAQFRLGVVIQQLALAIREARYRWQALQVTGLVLFVCVVISVWPTQLPTLFDTHQGVALQQMADYINQRTPAQARIEGYDSEVLFLIRRPYHFPPDQMNITVIQRGSYQQAVDLQYDPFQADPDYIVVGAFSRAYQIYDQAIASGRLRLVTQFGDYTLYQRQR